MRQKHTFLFLALVFLLFVFVWSTVVLAQTSSSFNLEWIVIGGGGQESSSTNYSVNGTIGQGITSQSSASSASFTVSSGYWFANPRTTIYLPTIMT